MSFSRNDFTMAPKWLSENFKLVKYEAITYHFKANDLEISNM